MSTISASTLITTALQYTADTTGALVFQTGATPTTALTLAADQSATFTGTVNFATAGFTNLSYTGTFTGGTGVVNIGSGQIYKTSGGDVGIGTTSPAAVSGYTVVQLNGASGGFLKISTGGTVNGQIYGNTGGLSYIANGSNIHYWYSGALNSETEKMRIDANGNLGLGVTSIAGNATNRVLNIQGADSANLVVTKTGAEVGSIYAYAGSIYAGSNTNSPFILNTFNTERMRIDTSGNVSIGTTASYAQITATGKAQFGLAADASPYSNGIATVSSSGTASSVMVFQSGVASGHFGIRASDTNIYMVNSYTDGLITNSAAIALTSSGNVGIGTTSPGVKLVVYGSGVRSSITDGTNSIVTGLWDGSTNRIEGAGRPIFITSYTTGVILGYSGSESMRIDTSNNVLMGTSANVTSAPKLLVYGNSTGKIGTVINNASASSGPAYIAFQGYDWVRSAIWHDRASGLALTIATNPDTSDLSINGCTPRVSITNSGALLVNTTTGVASTDNVHKIGEVSSGTAYARLMMQERGGNWISFNDGGGTNYGIIARSGSGVSYGSNSDYRLKENVQPMVGGLDRVSRLKPVTYVWKDSKLRGEGFIAHELQEVIPDAVVGEKDGINPETDTPSYQTVDTSYVVATLVAAIQELKAEFEEYKATHP